MNADMLDEIRVPTDPEEQRLLHEEALRRWLRLTPGGADEVRELSLRRQFEHRLRRPLDAAEQEAMRHRIQTLGADQVGEVVLDLDAAALAAWLADPAR